MIETDKATDWPLVESDMAEWKEWSGAGRDDKKIQKLADGVHQIYSRFGVADHISLLDWGVRLSWHSTPPGLARYAQVSMDPELLHYLGRAAGRRCEINLYLDGDELTITGPWGKIWPRKHDLAEVGPQSS
jgi:hypothetical protein